MLNASETEQGQREALPRLLSSLSCMPVRVLLTLGGVVAPGTVLTPANVTVRGDVPHAAVLPHVESGTVTMIGATAVAQKGHVMTTLNDAKWGPAPPLVPPGAQIGGRQDGAGR